MPSFILASGSPRREDLLTRAGYTFTIRPAEGPEHIPGGSSPEAAVQQLARRKAAEVLDRFSDSVILAADTIISLEDRILGKPECREDARCTLQALSGRTHEVYTGVALFTRNRESVFHVKTGVRFFPLHADLIDSYLSTPEPYDKAGSYAIQGQGCLFVEAIDGDFYNVMGLPVSRVSRELTSFRVYPAFSSTY
ncbi:Maf family protein [Salibacterium sp. K-3]